MLFVVMSFCNLSYGDGVELVGETRGELHYIYHEKQMLVIQDQAYKMALNLKVFNLKGKPVNRYALKEGQNLHYFAEYSTSSNEYIVTSIKILN